MPATTPVYGFQYPLGTDPVRDGDDVIQTLALGVESTFGNWATYTPTLTNLTVGTGGTNSGRWIRIGKMLFGRINVVLGTAPTVGTNPTFTIPSGQTMATSPTAMPIASGTIVDASPLTIVPVTVYPTNSTTLQFTVWNAAGTYVSNSGLGAAIPFTWAVNDSINLSFAVEVV